MIFVSNMLSHLFILTLTTHTVVGQKWKIVQKIKRVCVTVQANSSVSLIRTFLIIYRAQ